MTDIDVEALKPPQDWPDRIELIGQTETALEALKAHDEPELAMAQRECQEYRLRANMAKTNREAHRMLEELHKAERRANSIYKGQYAISTGLRGMQNELYEAVEDGGELPGVDPLLVTGLRLRKGKVNLARNWAAAVEDAQERLQAGNEPFLFQSSTMRSISKLILGISGGGPAEVRHSLHQAPVLLVRDSVQATVHSTTRRLYSSAPQPDELTRVPLKELALHYDPPLYVGEEAVKKQIEKLFNWWGVVGDDAVDNDIMLFLWKAARSLGREDFVPSYAAEYMPGWKAKLLQAVTGSLVEEATGFRPERPVMPELSYFEQLTDMFTYDQAEVDLVLRRASLSVSRLACQQAFDADEKVALLPSLLQSVGISPTSPTGT